MNDGSKLSCDISAYWGQISQSANIARKCIYLNSILLVYPASLFCTSPSHHNLFMQNSFDINAVFKQIEQYSILSAFMK